MSNSMLTCPPGRPGPSSPGNLLTTQGCSGMRLATGGNAPDFTCWANIVVAHNVCSGSAANAWLQTRPKKKALVKTRRFILAARAAVTDPGFMTGWLAVDLQAALRSASSAQGLAKAARD